MADATWFRIFVGSLLALWCPLMLVSGRLPHFNRVGRWSDALAGAAGGVMGPLGGFTGAVPTLWCTLRGMDRDVQRAVIQHFKLAMLGLDARVTEREQSGRTVFRVRVGPFEHRDEAESAQGRLTEAAVEANLVRVER